MLPHYSTVVELRKGIKWDTLFSCEWQALSIHRGRNKKLPENDYADFLGGFGGGREMTLRSFGETLNIFNSKYVSHFNQTSSVLFWAEQFAFRLCHGGSYESAKLSNIITIRKLSCIIHVNYAEANTADRKMYFPLQYFLPRRDFRHWLDQVSFSRLNLQTKRMSAMPVPWQTTVLPLDFCSLQLVDLQCRDFASS